jgi:hypothetical protein
MMKLLKSVAVVVGLVLSSHAIANSCNTIDNIHGLSNEQRQAMIVQCETEKLQRIAEQKTKEVLKEPSVVIDQIQQTLSVENLNKTAEIAKVAGQTVKEVAKELNVASNEFVQTPLGMFVAGVAVWYVAGDNITGFLQGFYELIGGLFLLILIPFTIGKFRKGLYFKEYTEKTVKTVFGNEKIVKVPEYYSWSKVSGDTAGFIGLAHLIEIIAYVIAVVIIL